MRIAVNAILMSLDWPGFLYPLLRIYLGTLRLKFLMPDGTWIPLDQSDFKPVLFAHSERDDFVIAAVLPRTRFAVLINYGQEGDWATRALERAGALVVRGSSRKKGSQALMELVKMLQACAHPAAICVDGPLGPQGHVYPGIIACARHTGRPIIPVGTAASSRIIFRKTWAQIYFPLPFSKAVIAFGSPIYVGKEDGRDRMTELRRELAGYLKALRQRAEQGLQEI